MELELAITSYQRLSPTVTSSLKFSTATHYVLGRSKDCDWCLPDPDRTISSRHAEIFFDGSRFRIRDISTNGVFINDASEALGKGEEVSLRDGDRLRFGDYEFGARVIDSAPIPSPQAIGQSPGSAVLPSPAQAIGPSGPSLGDLPVAEGMGGNPMLASGLCDQGRSDSHVDIPDVEIPPVWEWDKTEKSEVTPAPHSGPASDALQNALFQGLGMPQLAAQSVSGEQMHALGDLTRILLDRLLELLHARAEQKQKLRVQQTLFQRSENNPLKFSATAQDAIEALLVRRHDSFLGPQDAVIAAFDDIMNHERALMVGVERVISDILQEKQSTASSGLARLPVLRKARMYDDWQKNRNHLHEEYGDGARMLRSDVFIEAYEKAVRKGEQE